MVKALSLVLFATLWAGCQSVNPALLDEEGGHIKDLPAVPYKIAVGPVADWPEPDPAAENLRINKNANEIRDGLVFYLNQFNTTGVEVLKVEGLDEAKQAKADLFIHPRYVGGAEPAASEVSDRWVAAGGFWLVTWIGGLFVDDYNYESNFNLQCDITNCLEVDEPLAAKQVAGGTVSLHYWDRNSFPSLRFLESLVLPPFWTSDDQDITSDSLTAQAIEATSARLSRFLKEELDGTVRDEVGSFRLITPGTASAAVPEAFELSFEIKSSYRVSEVAIYLNDSDPLIPTVPSGPPGADGFYYCSIQQPVSGLKANSVNEIRIESTLENGKNIGRTVAVTVASGGS